MNQDHDGPDARPQRASHDAALDRAWHEASDEQPSAQLDAAIIAAARQSVANHRVETLVTPTARLPPPRRFTQWQPLAVAASVAGLAFILVQTLPRESALAPSRQRQDAASTPASAPRQQTSPARKTIDKPAPDAKASAPTQERFESRGRTQAQEAVAATPGDTTTASSVAAPPQPATAPDGPNEAAAADLAVPAMGPARDGTLGARERVDPTDWAASIAAQYAAGDLAGAAAGLRAFRTSEPQADEYLPDALRAWARSVQ